LTSMDSKKLFAPPSSNQQGTWRVSNATTTATSRNAPSTLAISSSVVSRTRVTGPSSYRLQTLEGEDVNNSWNVDQLCRLYA
jgi:hypothetical protein